MATSIVFLVMVSVIFFWMKNLEISTRYNAEQELHRDLAAYLVSDNPLLQEGSIDAVALENLFHTMMILGPSFEFYVLDAKGNVKTFSALPGQVVRKTVDLKPILQMLSKQVHFPLRGDDPRTKDGVKIFTVAPLIHQGLLQGYLYIIIGGQIYDSIFQRILIGQSLQLTLIVSIAAILFLFATLLLSFKIFVTPLRKLTNEVKIIQGEGFDKKLSLLTFPDSNHGEVQELGYAFNEMIKQLNLKMTLLQEVDAQRRELLSHISHDLRTPLASLQGYIETIDLRSDSLSQEQQKSFIKRALKNALQLKKLVDQIFELAHLESGQITIQIEQFSLREMLYDLREKFAIKANSKNIDISIECPEGSLLIKTDIGKLERILSNLIENALRHTHIDGRIILGVNVVSGQPGWVVSVEDNGEGIPSDDILHIFEASYRGKNAKTGDNVHIGLGLSITQKLLNVLDSEIRVRSVLGEGSRFSFHLNIAV